MSHAFRMPDLGEGIAEAEVVRWCVAAGATIAEDDPLVEVETDKAIMEIPSPYSGTILDIFVEAGAVVAVGAPLVLIGDADASRPVSPVATAPRVNACAPPAPKPDGRRQPLTGLRRVTAAHVTRAHREIPAVSIVDECDLTAVPRIGLTYLPWIVAAAAHTLRELPELNATIVDEELVLHDRIDIGIAVQSPDGLLVPVIRDADQRSVADLADEIRALTSAARERTLAPDELRDSTFTITAAGRRGGLFATPLINHPEVAILGVHKISNRPVVQRGEVVVGRIGCLSCTFDHRAVDGLAGGEFLRRVIRWVSSSTATSERT